jgi:hypothetical protein
MKKISKVEENRMLDTINGVISKCASGADPSQAVADLAVQKNLSTEEAARVCEAVNKIASIEYLSRNGNNKSESFPLADSKEVVQMMKDTRKVANDPFKFRKTASEGLHTFNKEEMLSKIAADKKNLPDVDPKWAYSAAWEKMQAHSAALKLASDEARLARIKVEYEFEDLAKEFDTLSKEASEDIARYAVNYYGHEGHEFLNALENVGIDKFERLDKPYVKTGSELERKVDKFMKDADDYLALKYATDFFNNAVKEAAFPKPGKADYEKPTDGFTIDVDNNFVSDLQANPENHGVEKVLSVSDRNSKGWTDAADKASRQEKATLNRMKTRDDILIHQMDNPVERAREEMKARHEDRAYELEKRRKALMDTALSAGGTTSRDVSTFMDDLITSAVNNTKGALQTGVEAMAKANALRQALQPSHMSGNEYSEPLSLSASKYLDSLDLHDAFAKAYLSDPYLRQYPPEEVAEAFNIVHEVAPDLITKNSSPHVVSAMLRKYLANNNQIDPLEIKDLTTTEGERKRTELTERQIENYKRNKPAAK